MWVKLPYLSEPHTFVCFFVHSFFFSVPLSYLRIFFFFFLSQLYILFTSWLLLRVSPTAQLLLACLEEPSSILSEQLAVVLR